MNQLFSVNPTSLAAMATLFGIVLYSTSISPISTAAIGYYIHPHPSEFTDYCDVQHNVKCIGDWIAETNSSDPYLCEQECARTPGCLAYATNEQMNKCVLKRAPISCYTEAGWKIKAKHRPVRGYTSKCWQDCANVVLSQLETNDANYCAQQCDNNPECVGFAVCYVCKRCWLHWTNTNCNNFTHYSVLYTRNGGAPKPMTKLFQPIS